MNIYNSAEELIGKTPLVEFKNIEKKYDLKARLLGKMEFLNPAGSAKDRVAKGMLDDAITKGLIKDDTVIIEPTSGNTGIGLACMGAIRGYKTIIVMPDTMSKERIAIMKAYGAEVVLSDGKLGMKGAIDKAEELANKYPSSFIPGQFDNPANPLSHYKTTGPEIYEDTDGQVDIFVAGIGTGGTISGTGRYLKEKKKSVKLIGVEPFSSPVITKGVAGSHAIQGIGANFVPKNLDLGVVDEVVTITNEEAFEYGKMFGKTEGMLVGISSGAALAAAIKEAKKIENKGKMIVVLLPDTGDRYLSTKLFED